MEDDPEDEEAEVEEHVEADMDEAWMVGSDGDTG